MISPKTSLHFLLAVACAVFATASFGCGKRRPPLPPIERVQQRTELLSGAQQGNEVILSWPAPQRNAPDSSVQSIRRIDAAYVSGMLAETVKDQDLSRYIL